MIRDLYIEIKSHNEWMKKGKSETNLFTKTDSSLTLPSPITFLLWGKQQKILNCVKAISTWAGIIKMSTVLFWVVAIIGFYRTKVTYFGNLVPELYTTQEITNQFSFMYMIAKSLYILLSFSLTRTTFHVKDWFMDTFTAHSLLLPNEC